MRALHCLFAVVLIAAAPTLWAKCPAPVTSAEPAPSAASAGSAAPADAAAMFRLPDTVVPVHYGLRLRVDPGAKGFSGTAEIRLRLLQPTKLFSIHALDLKVDGFSLQDAGGKEIPAALEVATSLCADAPNDTVDVSFDSALPPQELLLRIDYHADYNSQLEGLYKTTRAGKPYVVTQMEPISARRAFPGFDEPRFKATFDLQLDVPPGQQAVANTAQAEEQKLADGWRRITFRTTPKLPTYLIALAVGPWDLVDGPPIPATRWREQPVPLRGIAPAGEGPRIKEALASTPAIVTALEDYFGYPYAFGKLDLLAAPDFSAGAMENPGLVIFREPLLLLDANTPTSLRRTAFEVNAHELAHQWFGDTVTMPWWDDLWLNEAFATWMEGRITARLRPAHRADLQGIEAAQKAMAADSLASARRVRQPIVDNGDIEGAFDSLTYGKGAAVLGMFEAWLGEDVFRQGIRQYMKQHAFANATSDDLVDALAKAGDKGKSLGAAMRSFLDQPGVPLVASTLRCDGGKAVLELSQQRYFPAGSRGDSAQRWGIPLCVRSSRDGKVTTQCELFDQARGRITLEGGCPDWYLPNAQARGYYRVRMADADMAALTKTAASLDERDQLAFADAIKAGFQRGDVSAPALLAALGQLAKSPLREVAFALQDELVWLRRNLVDDTARAAVDAYVSGLYLPQLERLGYLRRSGESDDDALRRAALAELLARKVDNEKVRQALLQQGDAVLRGDGNGRLRFGAANYDLLGTVLAVTVQQRGGAAIDALIAETARNSDASLRLSMVMAMGATTDPEQAERVREFAISPAAKVSETARILRMQQYEPRNRLALWYWFQRRYNEVVKHTPAFVHGDLPELVAQDWCEAEQAERIAAFFTRTAVNASGAAQGLQRADEAIRLCVALKARQGTDSLRGWTAP